MTKRYIFLVIIGLLVLAVFYPSLKQRFFPPVPQKQSVESILVNRSFEFTAQNKAGETEEKLKFTLVSAEKVKQVSRQNVPIRAAEDQEFLVIGLELENETKETLYLYPAELIRLVDEQGKKFAPDYYNQMAEVLPISVKKDEIAFNVNATQKTFHLQVGEIEGEKETIEIKF